MNVNETTVYVVVSEDVSSAAVAIHDDRLIRSGPPNEGVILDKDEVRTSPCQGIAPGLRAAVGSIICPILALPEDPELSYISHIEKDFGEVIIAFYLTGGDSDFISNFRNNARALIDIAMAAEEAFYAWSESPAFMVNPKLMYRLQDALEKLKS